MIYYKIAYVCKTNLQFFYEFTNFVLRKANYNNL